MAQPSFEQRPEINPLQVVPLQPLDDMDGAQSALQPSIAELAEPISPPNLDLASLGILPEMTTSTVTPIKKVGNQIAVSGIAVPAEVETAPIDHLGQTIGPKINEIRIYSRSGELVNSLDTTMGPALDILQGKSTEYRNESLTGTMYATGYLSALEARQADQVAAAQELSQVVVGYETIRQEFEAFRDLAGTKDEELRARCEALQETVAMLQEASQDRHFLLKQQANITNLINELNTERKKYYSGTGPITDEDVRLKGLEKDRITLQANVARDHEVKLNNSYASLEVEIENLVVTARRRWADYDTLQTSMVNYGALLQRAWEKYARANTAFQTYSYEEYLQHNSSVVVSHRFARLAMRGNWRQEAEVPITVSAHDATRQPANTPSSIQPIADLAPGKMPTVVKRLDRNQNQPQIVTTAELVPVNRQPAATVSRTPVPVKRRGVLSRVFGR